jgi:cytochrome c
VICTTIYATAAPASNRIKGQVGALLTILLPIVGLFFPFSTTAQNADGTRLFQQRCATCHSVEAGQNKAGPHLSGLIGRAAGTVEGATYSDAMRSSGITWDSRTLDTFLAAPARMLRGTRMTVAIPNATQRAAIIQYLEGQSAD